MVAIVVLAMIGSGCATASPDASNTADTQQSALKFSQCMRANGISAFPDPPASGEFTIDEVANGSSLDTNTPAFQNALTACKSLEPATFTGSKNPLTPQQHAARLEFATCMRNNGVPDFPDPASDTAPLIDTTKIPSAATSSGMSILHAAMQKCSGYASAAGIHK